MDMVNTMAKQRKLVFGACAKAFFDKVKTTKEEDASDSRLCL